MCGLGVGYRLSHACIEENEDGARAEDKCGRQ